MGGVQVCWERWQGWTCQLAAFAVKRMRFGSGVMVGVGSCGCRQIRWADHAVQVAGQCLLSRCSTHHVAHIWYTHGKGMMQT